MKFKNVSKIISAVGKGIDEYGPQIMAVGSAVCFVAGVIFAAKESPAAFEALEEKLEDNPDMNIVEKGATVISRMPKTVVATLSGLAMHIFAWKKILGKVATLTGALALAKQDNSTLIEAAKEVVGPDKAKEIVKTKDQMTQYEKNGTWSPNSVESAEVMYPYEWDGFGIAEWMTPATYEMRDRENIAQLADNEELPIYDYFFNFGVANPPTLDIGWNCDGRGCGASPSDMLRWAKDELHAELVPHMYKGKYPGFLVKLDNMPTEAVENR